MTREHILLFENEKGLKRIMTLLLRQAEMRVTSADRADRALDIIHSAHAGEDGINVAIIDLSYPYPEGEKLLRQLQEKESNPPTIIITQYGEESTIYTDSGGCNLSLLPAPFEPTDLLNSIKKATFQTDSGKIADKQHNQEEKP
ncbi:MAG: response regulator [Thermodesulfobacteriota bacterium]